MRKVCRKCKLFVEGNECPLCHGNQFSESWKGRIIFFDAEKSEIAKRTSTKVKGEYTIKVR